jgi:ribosome-binding factor A
MSNKTSTSGRGPSQRQLRVGELIRRSLSQLLNRSEIHDPDLNRMSITVGEVSLSNDLKVATVYVMPLMGGATAQEAVEALARNKFELRKRVMHGLTLKYAPDLRFRPDETFDRWCSAIWRNRMKMRPRAERRPRDPGHSRACCHGLCRAGSGAQLRRPQL